LGGGDCGDFDINGSIDVKSFFTGPEVFSSGDFGASFVFESFFGQSKYSFLFFFGFGRRRS
jgi:hypothetical protein